MIQPSEIETKAGRIYAAYVRAWLAGEKDFFPKHIPCDKMPDAHLPTAIRQVRAIQKASKESIGYGFSVDWQEVNSRTHGRNLFPIRISFHTATDLLKYTKKEREFQILTETAARVRENFPELHSWIRSNPKALLSIAPEVEGLLEVVNCLKRAPRPGCFARELPLKVDTKFVAGHQPLLREWLDLILPPEAIRADEEHFERRYGLSYVEPPILIRALDPAVQQALSLPCPALWLPLHSLSVLERHNGCVVIVENLVNLMTLPFLSNGVAIGGLGNSVLLLRYAPWLNSVPVFYWGDIDAEGFEILSRLRAHFPGIRSVMMEGETIERFKHLIGKGNDRSGAATPPHLSEEEARAFSQCVENSVRLEQERIPHCDCISYFRREIGTF